MREWIARGIVALTFAALVALAFAFALRHNPERNPPGAAPRSADATRGAAIFSAQGCAGCHAIGGQGNPRHPLDDVGRRRDPAALRDWILGEGEAAAELPPSIAQRKQHYRELPEAELAALVAYLSTLRSGEEGTSP